MENLLTYGICTLAILIIILFIWIIILGKRIKQLSAGQNGVSLEKVIVETNTLAKELKQTQKDHHLHIINLRTDISKTIQNISVVRFDALREMGGMQSFAISLLDSHKNGVVISSMYTRDRMNVFAKEIIKGESKRTLTEEEKEVINQ